MAIGAITCQASIIDPHEVDMKLFDRFVTGETVDEVTKQLLRGQNEVDHLVREHVNDSYRVFNYLLHYLQRPYLFIRSCPVPLQQDIRHKLITRYFYLDPAVARELYGKKIKELRVRNVRERYQVENVKLVYKQFMKERDSNEGDVEEQLIAGLMTHFELPRDLATSYAVVCFSCKWALTINKPRSKTVQLSWSDLSKVTEEMLLSWCGGLSGCNIMPDFTTTLKLVKSVLKDTTLDGYCNEIIGRMSPASAVSQKTSKVVKTSIQHILSFGASLSTKLPSLFVICEQLLEDTQNGMQGIPSGSSALLQSMLLVDLHSEKASSPSTKKFKTIPSAASTHWKAYLQVLLSVSQHLAGTERQFRSSVATHADPMM
eukprot:TRINITY_DN6968_c0_g1_i1.p1 TRINITY_DN6968_c0_g1~~TRINITY_DN6968_c0_g1_i1.p1  ORF type:complete len:373 (+),score=44.37 TRINITY_DN6968_c0_g1_i1:47-1165(+)